MQKTHVTETLVRMRLNGIICLLAAPFLLGGCATVKHSSRDFFGRPASFKPAEAQAFSDFLVARYASMTDDPDVAAEKYAAALVSAPHKSGIAERAVFSALLSGDYEAAVDLAEQADVIGSQAALVRMTLGVEAVRDKRNRDIRTYLGEAHYGPFNNLIAQGLYSWHLYERRGVEAAVAYQRNRLSGRPSLDTIPHYMMAFIQASAGRDAAALDTFDHLWAAGGRVAIGVEVHASLLAAKGERQDALDLLETFEAEVGHNAALSRLHERILSGAPVEPVRLTYEEGTALAVYIPSAVLMSRGVDDDMSAVYFSLALALDPDRHVARSLWAQSLIHAGREEEAIAVLSRIPENSAFYASSLGQMAWALHGIGRDEEALRLASSAGRLRLDKSLALQLASLYQALDDNQAADEVLTAAINQGAHANPPDWRMLFARGTVRQAMGNWPAAEQDLTTAHALNPADPSLLNYLGSAYIARGEQLERALVMVEEAVAAQPQVSEFVDGLGWAYYTLGRYDEALQWLEHGVELDPGNPVLNDHLGDAYWQAGRKIEARYQWQRVLKLSPNDMNAEQIQMKILQGPAHISTQHAVMDTSRLASQTTQP